MRGSFVLGLCGKTAKAVPRLIITTKVRRRYTRMISSFLLLMSTKGTNLFLCILCFFLATLFALVVLAGVAAGYGAIPTRVMCPRPFLRHCAIDHRMKRSGLVGCSFVDVNYESRQHQERCYVVDHITHCDNPTSGEVVEPHQDAGDEK